jgi:hypothetical protein
MIIKIKLQDGEYFWGGDAANGWEMPVCKDTDYFRDLRYQSTTQHMPCIYHQRVDMCGVKKQ